MSKSKRTQQHYRKEWRSQTALDAFGFTCKETPSPGFTATMARKSDSLTPLVAAPCDSDTYSPSQSCMQPIKALPNIRQASILSVSDSSTGLGVSDDDHDGVSHESLAAAGSQGGDEELVMRHDDSEAEDWKDELDDTIRGPTAEVKDWTVLREQIKMDLKNKHKILPLSQINQLMILSNFATLHIKGVSRISASVEITHQWQDSSGMWFARRVRALACHYQTFEQLPQEKRGGRREARSFLHDESVQSHCRTWLSNVPTGQVTPHELQHAIEAIIFPELGIVPKQPISLRMAQRWLIKLGWCRTVIRKGVYMDGHEREDVVKYCNKIYLPKMLAFERRMVKFEGPDLVRVEPTLEPGERHIKPYYHDECCFHVNDNIQSAWYVFCFRIIPLNSVICLLNFIGFVPMSMSCIKREKVTSFMSQTLSMRKTDDLFCKVLIMKSLKMPVGSSSQGLMVTAGGHTKIFLNRSRQRSKSMKKLMDQMFKPCSFLITHLLMPHYPLMPYVHST